MLKRTLIIAAPLVILSLLLAFILVSIAPKSNPILIFLVAFVLMMTLMGILAGFILPFRHYLRIVLVCAVIVLSIPFVLHDQVQTVACTTRGRTSIHQLKELPAGLPVAFCGELVFCALESLTGDDRVQEACLIRDVNHPQDVVMFYNFTQAERVRDPDRVEEQGSLSLMNAAEGSLVIRDAFYEADLFTACAVPNACTAEAIPFGELYGDALVYEDLR